MAFYPELFRVLMCSLKGTSALVFNFYICLSYFYICPLFFHMGRMCSNLDGKSLSRLLGGGGGGGLFYRGVSSLSATTKTF